MNKSVLDIPDLQSMRINPDMVKRAASYARRPVLDPDAVRIAHDRVEGAQKVKQTLLPIERAEFKNVGDMLARFTCESRKVSIQSRIAALGRGYKILDLAPLKWRNAEHLPFFGVFAHDNPLTGFRSVIERDQRGNQKVESGPLFELPKPIRACFADIEEIVQERALRVAQTQFGVTKVETTLFAEFSGLIPLDVKEEMAFAAQTNLFQCLLIVAEVEEWKFNTIVTSRRGDPLVIGWDGFQTWLIAVFDTTSAEQIYADLCDVETSTRN